MRALAAFFNGEKSDMSVSSTLTAATTSSCREVLGAGTARPPASPSTRTSMPPPIALHPVSGQGNVFADCEIQKVWDENGTLYLAGAHHDGRVSVEMRQLTDEGERLWGQLDYEDYLPLEGLTAMGKHYELGDENRFVHDLYNSPELCAAPVT